MVAAKIVILRQARPSKTRSIGRVSLARGASNGVQIEIGKFLVWTAAGITSWVILIGIGIGVYQLAKIL